MLNYFGIGFVCLQDKYAKGDHWVCAIRDGKIKRYCKCDYFKTTSDLATTPLATAITTTTTTTSDGELIIAPTTTACKPSFSFPSLGKKFTL